MKFVIIKNDLISLYSSEYTVLRMLRPTFGCVRDDNRVCVCVCVCSESLQSCPILCDPTNSSPPASSVYGILQPRTLPNPGIKHVSPEFLTLQADSLPLSLSGSLRNDDLMQMNIDL